MRFEVLQQMARFNKWANRQRFLAWCDDVTRRDDADSYIDEIRAQERFLGITDQDRADYRAAKQRELEPLPF